MTAKLADLQARIAAKDYAAAQAALSQLESLLNAMESAKQVLRQPPRQAGGVEERADPGGARGRR